MERIAYFAYGTTRQGFAHHERFADMLGEPAARVRTAAAHAVVVPHRAACGNPGCEYVHRMAALVPGLAPLRVDDDLFMIGTAAVERLDRLELGAAGAGGPYVRGIVDVIVPADGSRHAALAYLAREPERWRALVERGAAAALPAYPRELAGERPRLKDCCVRSPGHSPPHDTSDPLAIVTGTD